MRSVTLKWIVLTSTLVIAVIIGVQLFWLNTVYSFEKKNFNTNVIKSVRAIYEDMALVKSPVYHLHDLIETPALDYYMFRTDLPFNRDSLIWYLRDEFANFDVLTDAHVGFYDAATNALQSSRYVSTIAPSYARRPSGLKGYARSHDYVLVYFPHRNKFILSQMNFWFISGGLLIVVLIGLAISLFYFYRQKFLAETQKDFVNNFTHEFKTPLAVMKISTEVLLQDRIAEQPDRLKRYAAIIRDQTEHLQSQVERLLRVAASDRRELPIQRSRVPVHEVVEDAIAKVQPLVEEKQARIEVQEEANDFELLADKAHLELALINLLENSLKYSVRPYVIITTGHENGDVFISIKDNGIGIEKKFQKKLFKKFYRVPTGDVHNVKGFGLGLNFVKRVIDAHRGKIKIHSLPGIGTEFKLILPATTNN